MCNYTCLNHLVCYVGWTADNFLSALELISCVFSKIFSLSTSTRCNQISFFWVALWNRLHSVSITNTSKESNANALPPPPPNNNNNNKKSRMLYGNMHVLQKTFSTWKDFYFLIKTQKKKVFHMSSEMRERGFLLTWDSPGFHLSHLHWTSTLSLRFEDFIIPFFYYLFIYWHFSLCLYAILVILEIQILIQWRLYLC